MRTILFIAGILIVCWLGYLTIQHFAMQTDMDSHHNQIQNHDEIINGQNNGINNQVDKLDRKEDKYDKKIEMPYENKKTNENTNLKRENNKDIPSSVKPQEPAKQPAKKPVEPKKPQANANESMVAYAYLGDDGVADKFYPAIEAFKIGMFPQDAVIAFKVVE